MGRAPVLGIDYEHNATNLNRGAQATPRSGGQELPAETLALKAEVYSNTREPKPWHIVPGEPMANRLGGIRISERSRRQAIKPHNRLVVCVMNCEEGLGAAGFMALTSVSLQEII